MSFSRDEHLAALVVLVNHALDVRLCRLQGNTAASCAVVGADMIWYWWTLTMPSSRSLGAQA